ncbi:hypothetical protein ACQY0O_002037 [Thecaphora frezii]
MRVLDHTFLSYSRLILHLSSSRHLLSALHIRNTLLSAYSGVELYSTHLASLPSDEAERWKTLLGFLGDDASVVTVGSVPKHLLLSRPPPTSEDQDQDAQLQGPWALIVTANRWRTPQGVKPPRINVWISNRDTHPSLHDRWQKQWDELATWIFRHYLPAYAQRVARNAAKREREEVEGGRKRQPVVFSGMQHELVEACKRVVEQATEDRVRWENPCFHYVKRVEVDKDMGEVPEEWKVDSMRKEDVELVRRRRTGFPPIVASMGTRLIEAWDLVSYVLRDAMRGRGQVRTSNKLAFPADLIRSRMHVSVMVRRVWTPSADGVGVRGQAMGWAYAHEDLSIGSLHVLAEFRRGAKAYGRGVGATVVEGIEKKIVEAAKRAWVASGASQLGEAGEGEEHEELGSTPCSAWIEEGNEASQRFFTRLGYGNVARGAWMGVEYGV